MAGEVRFVKAAREGEIPVGRGKMVFGPHDKPIALFHHEDGGYYAVNYVCPHMGGPIGEGKLRGYIVDCPWHGWSYDIRDGKDPTPPGHDITAYEVKVENGVVLVGWVKPPA